MKRKREVQRERESTQLVVYFILQSSSKVQKQIQSIHHGCRWIVNVSTGLKARVTQKKREKRKGKERRTQVNTCTHTHTHKQTQEGIYI